MSDTRCTRVVCGVCVGEQSAPDPDRLVGMSSLDYRMNLRNGHRIVPSFVAVSDTFPVSDITQCQYTLTLCSLCRSVGVGHVLGAREAGE